MRKLRALAIIERMVKLISKIITRNKRNSHIQAPIIEPLHAIILMLLMNYLMLIFGRSKHIKSAYLDVYIPG